MSTHMPRDPDPQLFSHVYTYDGKHLGIVRDTTEGYFKVQVRWGRDYWLNDVLVRESTPRRVLLHVSHDTLDSYKTHELDGSFRIETSPPGQAGSRQEARAMNDKDGLRDVQED